jgi:hypothetical protein
MNGKRKFIMSGAIILLSALMVFTGELDGGAWVTIATLSLGLYAASNVVDKKLGGQG